MQDEYVLSLQQRVSKKIQQSFHLLQKPLLQNNKLKWDDSDFTWMEIFLLLLSLKRASQASKRIGKLENRKVVYREVL